MKSKVLVLAVVIALFGINVGWAQVNSFLRANIPFDFTVGSKELPAGQYDIAREALNNAISVRSTKGGVSSDAIVLARLWADIHTTPQDSHLVFDQVGDKYILSELWIPGSNGFLLNITKEKHTFKAITILK